MSKLFPVFLKWTIWGFSLETYNHQDICIHRCLTCWFSPLHVPGCERTWVLWFFWFIWVFKYFLGNVRTSKFYNLCFYLKKKKKVILTKEKNQLLFVLLSRSKLFYSFPILLAFLVCLQSLNGPQTCTLPAHTKNASISRNYFCHGLYRTIMVS